MRVRLRGYQLNTDRYEEDWKFDTDRRLARLENCDAGARIAALEERLSLLEEIAAIEEKLRELRLNKRLIQHKFAHLQHHSF